jgi:alpha-L-fucosidase
MYNAKIPVADYVREAAQFNPTAFDADAWVRLAKQAGQRYIVITAKHCEGFALFKSQASPFNIVDHTAFRRDVIKELAGACQRHGIRLGLYYSQAMDWHHPGGAAHQNTFNGGDPGAGRWDRAQEGNFDDYLERVAVPQVRELLTQYGPVAVLWWDAPVGMNRTRAEKFHELLSLQPGIITNNRLNNRSEGVFLGDTETPEQFIPPTGFKDRDFEVCMTMNDTWGYKRHDQNWKPATDLIRKLVDVASKGGNFLLNVGPDELGRIPQPSVERLQAMGRWIRTNGEAIYGTAASPFAKLPWGRCTRLRRGFGGLARVGESGEGGDRGGEILHFHVFDWPIDGRLVVPGLKTPIRSAQLLADGSSLLCEFQRDGALIHLPSSAPDTAASVIRVELAGALVVDNRLPRPGVDGTGDLPLWMTDIHNPGYGEEARLGIDSGSTAIVNWADPRVRLAWTFEAAVPEFCEVVATFGPTKPGGQLRLQIGKEAITAKVATDGKPTVLGKLRIPVAGVHELSLQPLKEGWQPLILRAISLRPGRHESAD